LDGVSESPAAPRNTPFHRGPFVLASLEGPRQVPTHSKKNHITPSGRGIEYMYELVRLPVPRPRLPTCLPTTRWEGRRSFIEL
jgi:hypothetical protein